MHILFLDFDGVLHPGMAGSFSKLPRFEAFLRAQPTIQVVLSTSWRLSFPFEDLRDFFAPDLRARVIGATGCLPDDTPAQRYQEICQWRRSNLAWQLPWVAVDDMADLFPSYCPELVLCEAIRGLQPGHLVAICRVLGLPASADCAIKPE